MNIGIDESGTFVYTTAQDAWNCVAAYVYPESDRRRLSTLIAELKRRIGKPGAPEVKLRDIQENDYLWLLNNLRPLEGLLFVIATDASLNTPDVIQRHQTQQVENILKPIPIMHHEEGRQALRELADKISRLPMQLYVQMFSQVHLAISILHGAVLYFAQRRPQTLGHFRWRIDQKNSEKTEYEEAFSQVLPALMQSASLREPMIILEEGNYSWFDRFHFPEGEEPTYLEDDYGIDLGDAGRRTINVGKIVKENAAFVNSQENLGVQVADLLASGLRRCLRGGFEKNDAVAQLLGSVMVQHVEHDVSIKLISFGVENNEIGNEVARVVSIMHDHARPLLTP